MTHPSGRLRAALRLAAGAAPRPGYSGVPTCRPLDSHLEDASWLKRSLSHSAVALVDPGAPAASVDASGSLAWLSAAQADALADQTHPPTRVILGRRTAAALPPSFLNERYARVAADTWMYAQAADMRVPVTGGTGSFVGLRELPARASMADAALAGQARSLLHWHSTHAYCGCAALRTHLVAASIVHAWSYRGRLCTSCSLRSSLALCSQCGGATVAAKGGWKRVCGTCGAQHFPRTDPVVIAAVISPGGDKCLLGRQAKWPAGRFSCLAGFVDPGETLEEAVRREVREEAGVPIAPGDAFYFSSQPWPNGPASQLMCGFLAIAESEHLTIDLAELEAARWVPMAEVEAALDAAAARGSAPTGTVMGAAGATSPVNEGTGMTDAPPRLLLPEPLAIAHSLLRAAVLAAQEAANT